MSGGLTMGRGTQRPKMGEPTTQELRVEQIQRQREEREAADPAEIPADQRAHARRAEKAAYLERKLAERAEAEKRREQERG